MPITIPLVPNYASDQTNTTVLLVRLPPSHGTSEDAMALHRGEQRAHIVLVEAIVRYARNELQLHSGGRVAAGEGLSQSGPWVIPVKNRRPSPCPQASAPDC